MNTELENTNLTSNDANTVLPAVYIWKREGSFLDQIKEIWKCYINDSEYYVARIAVNTLGECRITINGDTHKSIIGIQNAKPYVESVLNGRQRIKALCSAE